MLARLREPQLYCGIGYGNAVGFSLRAAPPSGGATGGNVRRGGRRSFVEPVMAVFQQMNGPIAQFVALTCHANAFLRGLRIPEFFASNSTCKFCDWVRFFNVSRTLFGKARQIEVATTPNGWFRTPQGRRRSGGPTLLHLSERPGDFRSDVRRVCWRRRNVVREGYRSKGPDDSLAVKMGGMEPGRTGTSDLAGFLRSFFGTPIPIGPLHRSGRGHLPPASRTPEHLHFFREARLRRLYDCLCPGPSDFGFPGVSPPRSSQGLGTWRLRAAAREMHARRLPDGVGFRWYGVVE